jgi:hypothetical protein
MPIVTATRTAIPSSGRSGGSSHPQYQQENVIDMPELLSLPNEILSKILVLCFDKWDLYIGVGGRLKSRLPNQLALVCKQLSTLARAAQEAAFSGRIKINNYTFDLSDEDDEEDRARVRLSQSQSAEAGPVDFPCPYRCRVCASHWYINKVSPTRALRMIDSVRERTTCLWYGYLVTEVSPALSRFPNLQEVRHDVAPTLHVELALREVFEDEAVKMSDIVGRKHDTRIQEALDVSGLGAVKLCDTHAHMQYLYEITFGTKFITAESNKGKVPYDLVGPTRCNL